MTMRVIARTLLSAVAVAGCSSATADLAGGSSGGSSSGGAALSGSGGSMGAGGQSAHAGGSMGAGGSVVVSADAGVARGDAPPGQVSPTLSGDAPVVNWDTRTCNGCGDSGGAGGAIVGASGGSSGSGGSASSGGRSSGSGGSNDGGAAGLASGGASEAGGKTSAGSGGRAGTGGARGVGGMSGGGRGGTTGSGGGATGGPPDASPDLSGGRDSSPPDTMAPGADGGTDTSWTPCITQIRAVVPATSSLATYPLVAGDNMRVVLRAEIISGGPEAPVWDWQASREGVTIAAAALGQADPAAAAFPIVGEGKYTFKATARSSLCSAAVSAFASLPASACEDCDRGVILRAVAPPAAQVPVQAGYMALDGSAPFSQINIVLRKGLGVLVSPSVAGAKVPSYVRVSNLAGDLVSDGFAAKDIGFSTQLLEMEFGVLLEYDVLVVPVDGPGGDVVAATAPQLFQGMTPRQIKDSPFGLSGGVTVTGKTSSNGQAVADARVILTNHDPSLSAQAADLVFSSVGRADASGSYSLHTQPGQYWVSISPPNGSGLPEALGPMPINLAGNSDISFQWTTAEQAGLTLNVSDANHVPLDNARVRITSAQASKVGTLSLSGGGTQDANGNVRTEGTTSSGMVTFANLPAGASYNVLIVPAVLGPAAATTLYSLTVPAGGATYQLTTAAQSWISGQLLSTDGAPDWSKVRVVAYDRTVDTPEAPQTVNVRADGSYAIGVSPGRAYVVLVVPELGSGLARTFVGPGLLEGSEFVLPQEVPAVMPWSATVMDEYQRTLAGTALQIFCHPSWPRCVDSTVPLAETVAETGGAFLLELPASR